MPSDVFREHILTCFIADPIGIALRDEIGIDNICWEQDYPHSDSSWPNAPEEFARVAARYDVPDAEVNKITHENAMRWYRFDPFAHRSRGAVHGRRAADRGRRARRRDPIDGQGPIRRNDEDHARRAREQGHRCSRRFRKPQRRRFVSLRPATARAAPAATTRAARRGFFHPLVLRNAGYAPTTGPPQCSATGRPSTRSTCTASGGIPIAREVDDVHASVVVHRYAWERPSRARAVVWPYGPRADVRAPRSPRLRRGPARGRS